MSSFQAVNITILTVPDPPAARLGGEETPTTPRANSRFVVEAKMGEDVRNEDPSVKTPTRTTFVSLTGLAAQRPLPSSPFTPARELSQTPSNKSDASMEHSHRLTQSTASIQDVQDVQMGEGDEEEKDGSDNESVTSDSNRPSKKKKGQRFFCTDFPPCSLSFTRSEHLARHIRKHTGERPFQCHCSRRFSRLDNLRQHAQTVHVNEDIPAESLAATGTRFQRQIRADRVRPPGNRARSSTLNSTGGHSRGHSRNLSSSSITSTMSSMSVAPSPDARRRPPPLAMAGESTPSARARLSLNMDAYNPPLMGSPGPQIIDHDPQFNAPTTPISATFSTAADSPARFASTTQSPVFASRPVSWAGPPPSDRRLSISSASGNPFSGPPGQGLPPSLHSLQSSTAPPPLPSLPLPPTSGLVPGFFGQNSTYTGPITSDVAEPRRESNADADWRRRTWHPGSFAGPRPATSGLGYHQTPDALQPSFTTQPAASQTRLPGIESFDQVPPPPLLPRRQPSSMQIDPPARPLTYHAPSTETASIRGHEKRKSISWDTTLQGINRLNIASPGHSRDPWSQYISNNKISSNSRPMTAPYGCLDPRQPGNAPQSIQRSGRESPRTSHDQPVTPPKNKRKAWYNGPFVQIQRTLQRTSPEDSSSSEGVPTPGTMPEYHPAIVHSNGYVEAVAPRPPTDESKNASQAPIMDRPHPLYAQPYQTYYHRHGLSSLDYRSQREPDRGLVTFGQPLPPPSGNDMRRLEALVAVATGEQQIMDDRPPAPLDVYLR